MSHARARLLSAPLALLAMVGCHPSEEVPPSPGPQLQRFSSCEDLEDYVTDAWTEALLQARYGYYNVVDVEEATDAPSDAGSDDSSGPSDWSETNNQEAGVDEADLVKTDGDYLYIVQTTRGELTIVKSWPAAETAKVASLDLEGYPFSSFLNGDRLMVFSHVYSSYDDNGETTYRNGYATRISVIDVSDRASPSILREVDIEGSYTSARMIGDDVYVVLQTYSDMPWELWDVLWNDSVELPDMPEDASEIERASILSEARARLAPVVAEAVAELDTTDLVPRVFDHLPAEDVEGATLLSCTDIYHPEGISNPSVLSVAHIGFDDGDGTDVSATGLMADGWNVYASTDRLYIAQASWSWWWGFGDLDYATHIHQFALDGADTVYEASGAVDGWLLNSFSMGEHEGYLRVATTDIDWWWGTESELDQPGNNVFVLEQSGAELKTVGEIRGIAPDEQIYAARFMGDEGYVVTFRQVDPLFTLDLSDPKNPQLKGELEIPGYSAYLHPVGDDHLLAVGMDGTDEGELLGLAVSLFDVSDLAEPTLVQKLTFTSDDWGYSEALWDHHAFTFHDGVLSIPLYTYDWDETGYWDGFSGMLAIDVDIDAGTLTELGRVDHADLVAESECLWSGYYGYYGEGDVVVVEESDSADGGEGSEGSESGSEDTEEPPSDDEGGDEPTEYDACGEGYWWASVRRSVAIDGNLYSISDYGVKVNETANLENELAKVVFYPQTEE